MHQRFRPEHIEAFRAEHPDGIVVAHPECAHEVCSIADQVGSTDYIIKAVAEAPGRVDHRGRHRDPPGATGWTPRHPDKTIVSLDPLVCPCSTMFRIDAPHLAWMLENLVDGRVPNRITVDADTAEWAKVALERMLDIT